MTFLVDTATDVGEAALDAWDEAHQGKKREPGTRRFLVPVPVGDVEIEGGIARERMLLDLALGKRETDEDAAISLKDGSAELDIERVRPPSGYDIAAYG